MDIDTIKEIIKLAEDFECCPTCGNTVIQSHFCKICKERYSVPQDAYYFAQYLKELYGLKDEGGDSNSSQHLKYWVSLKGFYEINNIGNIISNIY